MTDVARALGLVSEEAITRVMDQRYPDTVDPLKLSAKRWLDKMLSADEDIEAVPCKGCSTESKTVPMSELELLCMQRFRENVSSQQFPELIECSFKNLFEVLPSDIVLN